ncbi:tRNA pseudouridine(38-40) synthase TruA [Nakamurella antarctica]|uniref:tRNA pseudouridine synthase A n=1 Tax=Nakamurella antarctica TaxID=1902245 RepID=A0A3G8ZPF2_9ACTN|nr:tRNA pseudouridine(38-40) synthase TruA [Nakamurella antarctica]AZI58665.1 tRNA pseudouridine(38-40) synthase TruA [Nakamurella antarctica]
MGTAPGGGPSSLAEKTIRLRLDLSYDGTAFSGWAIQPNLRTVAGELTAALHTLLRSPIDLVVAGRTDAGVHARGQVAHADVDAAALLALAPRTPAGVAKISGAESAARGPALQYFEPLRGLVRRLAGLLPLDIRVRTVVIAPRGFDARFAALRRHYRYRVTAEPSGVEPLRRFDTLGWPRALDAARMQEAADGLVGLHDFAAFCKPRVGATTVREVQRLVVNALDEEPVLAIDVSADAFCHSMVRSLVGALLAVGEGRLPITDPAVKLAARQRTSAIHVAPARGLTLMGVDYPLASELAARAQMTRAFRTLDS